MKKILLLFSFISFSLIGFSQTTLSAGDIAIFGINTDSPDNFGFVLLVDIEAGTEIRFTDSGWKSGTNSFRANEGCVKYTAPSALTAGTEITWVGNDPNFAADNDAGVGTGSVNLSTSGDQVIAFQGLSTAPTFIFAAQSNSTEWQIGSDDSNQSDLPQGLTNGVNAIAYGAGSGTETEYDNIGYDKSTMSGTAAEILAAVSDNANWGGDNSTLYNLTSYDFTVTGSAPPPAIAKPTFDPAGGTYYATQNVSISTITPGTEIFYTINGDDPTTDGIEYTGAVEITSTTTLKAAATLAPGNNADIDPWSDITEATYTIVETTPIATIAELRAAYANKADAVYTITGEVFLTFKQDYKNIKYVQDATAGIQIFDENGVITTIYDVGDGILNLTGTLDLRNGLLRITPVVDPGAANTTNNTLTPIQLSIEEFNDGLADYESMLIEVMAAHFDETVVGNDFTTGTNYTLSDNDGFEGVFRTEFYDADYINTPITSGNQDITGVMIQYNGTVQIFAREMADFAPSDVPLIPIGSAGIAIAALLMTAVIVTRKRLF